MKNQMDQEDTRFIGRTYTGRDPITITAERIASFCAAVGETNPLYVDPVAAAAGPYGGIIAPPAFVAGFRYGDDVFEQIPMFRRGGLMGGIDLELEEPLRPGDTIQLSSQVKDIYEKTGRTGTMVFAVVRTTLTNQKGQVVAHVEHRMMNRPPRDANTPR
jgi:3-hydroxybutyryl-CoA dehydratase